MDKDSIVRDVVKGIGDVAATIAVSEFIGALFGIKMPISYYIATKHKEKVNEQRLRFAEIKYNSGKENDDSSTVSSDEKEES